MEPREENWTGKAPGWGSLWERGVEVQSGSMERLFWNRSEEKDHGMNQIGVEKWKEPATTGLPACMEPEGVGERKEREIQITFMQLQWPL